MADFLTFQNIYQTVQRSLKVKGTEKLTLIKAIVNQVYLNEVLECDDLYPLFWLLKMDDSLAAVAAATISGITAADPGVITCSAAHGLSTSDIVSIYNTVGMTELNNRVFKVNSVPAAATLSLIDLYGVDAIDSTSFTAWSSGGTVVHRGRVLATSGVDVQKIFSAAWHDEKPMSEITQEQLEKETKWWNDSTGTPKRHSHQKFYSTAGVESNHLLWFPGSDNAYDLRYWTLTRASRLSADGDVPLLPPQFHDTIIAGTITRLAESKVQVENAVVWPSIYGAQLKAIQSFNREYWQKNEIQGLPYLT